MKVCNICLVPKEETEDNFRRSYRTRKRDGINPFIAVCIPCRKEKRKQEFIQTYDSLQRRALRYGVSKDQLISMLRSQNFKCAVCVVDIQETNFVVDHCHTTNKVRGLLCGPCNLGLGQLKDDVNVVRSLARYLERYGSL